MNTATSRPALARAATALLGALLLTGAWGCAPAATTVPTETPGVTGEIVYVAISTDAKSLATITVEGGEQPAGAVSDAAVVTVGKDTAVFDAEGKPASAESLTVGTTVRVWFTGPVAESYPVQGRASAVQIVSGP